MKFFDNIRQYLSIKPEIDKAIQRVIDSGQFILGREVYELEEKLAQYYGIKHAIGVGSGTDALRISYHILETHTAKHGIDTVLVPDFTYIASANIAKEHTITFCDVDEYGRMNMKMVSGNVLSIPVHLFGLMTEDLISRYIIEDGAQSIGAEFKGRRYYPNSDFVITSFFPTKNLGCFGDGGMIFTNNDNYADLARMIRVHGASKEDKYKHKILGMNSRLDTIQAAVLLVKLNYLDEWIEKRRILAKRYIDCLGGYVYTPIEPEGFKHVYNQFTIRTNRRDELKEYLKKKDIETMIYYPIPLHQQQCWNYNHKLPCGIICNYANSIALSKTVLSLPIYPELTVDEQDEIIGSIGDYFALR